MESLIDMAGTGRASFPATRWSMVLRARGEGGEATRALDELCRDYWPPVYAFIRRRGKSPADAEDLTQGFFASLLERRSLDGVAQEKGRLRTFLLKAVVRHMASDYERAAAIKRGGGIPDLSFDFKFEECRYLAELAHGISPDLEYQRQWALRLLDRALGVIREEAGRQGRLPLFEDLKGLISLNAAMDSYAEIAARHDLSEAAVKTAAHRLRGRFRSELRRRVAETVESEDQIDDEIRHLFSVFQRT